MPRPALKIVPFPVRTDPIITAQNNPDRRVLAVVKTRPPVSTPPDTRPHFMRHGGYALAVVATIALHGLWLSTATDSVPHPQATAPTILKVSWLPAPVVQAAATLQPKVNVPPKPQAKSQALPKARNKTPDKLLAKPSKNVFASNQGKRSVATNTTVVTPPNFVPSHVAAIANPTPPASAAPEPKAIAEPITLPHLNADYLHNPAPDYPTASRELGEQGRVLVRAKISADGKVEQILLRKSSGYARLDEAALASVKQWRFVPARQGAEQVAAWVVVPVAFSLEG
ncbi:energy transducer TonB [Methylovulum psychrotolerans]|uniref:energy transducer TonB n=1 Tax=Methylovulum psychrotolerans TaxID=1704499 RepID=UPI001BFFCBF5|nr:energy transducer TonB [Methylovulum psychrotolerans]MBT9097862.1 energy transducer TonB [Methylovulum psychrotolerans]